MLKENNSRFESANHYYCSFSTSFKIRQTNGENLKLVNEKQPEQVLRNTGIKPNVANKLTPQPIASALLGKSVEKILHKSAWVTCPPLCKDLVTRKVINLVRR